MNPESLQSQQSPVSHGWAEAMADSCGGCGREQSSSLTDLNGNYGLTVEST